MGEKNKGLKYVTIFLAIFFVSIRAALSEAYFSHKEFDDYLKFYVNNGRVNYGGMLKNREPLLKYLKNLAEYPLTKLREEPEDYQIAFYINAYNAITIKRILDNYPPVPKESFSLFGGGEKSIKNIPDVWDKTRDNVAGQMLTPNNIEHDILRKDFKEARIHFALVCAAKGCPVLPAYAFSGAKLRMQLNDAARLFLLDPAKNKFCAACDTTELSQIFQWYADDFIHKYGSNAILNNKYGKGLGSVLNFAGKYIPESQFKRLIGENHKVKFAEYDWELNE